ncbi:MAG: hypothetical protein KF849_01440 [Rhizobiaceae bacterium]|nr:hypothetical protein [Rhizobiaceae bacterium]
MRPLRALAADRRGNMATLTALSAPVALMFAAFAVDAGSLYLERRETQHVADLAAIAAASNPQRALQAALAVLSDNGFGDIAAASGGSGVPAANPDGSRHPLIDVKTGAYVADASVPAGQRFVVGALPANAVRVRIVKRGTRHFGYAFTAEPWISAASTASSQAEAAFSVGSRLARLDGGVLNALLSGLTGSSLSLTLMDYDALAAADVSLLSFLDAARTKLSLTAATYNEVLDTPLTVGDVSTTLLSVGGLSASAKAALGKLSGAGSSRKVPLRELLSLGPSGRLAPATPLPGDPKIGALELVSAMAYLAAANGKHQVAADIGAAVPGLLSARVKLAIGEPPQGSPWFVLEPEGAFVRTAQTRLLVEVEIGGPGGLLGTKVRLPLYLELAMAEARLDRVSCPTGGPDSLKVTVSARPGIAALRIADPDAGALTDFSRAPALAPAKIVTAPLVKVTGAAHVSISNPNWTALHFSRADIQALAVKRVSTTSITGSLTSSLLSNLSLNVDIAGLGIGLPSVLGGTVSGLLSAATPAVDGLLVTVLSTLGVTLGEADVRVHGATCGRSVLVQ